MESQGRSVRGCRQRRRVVDEQLDADAALECVAVERLVLGDRLAVGGDIDAARVYAGSDELVADELHPPFGQRLVVIGITTFVGKSIELDVNV